MLQLLVVPLALTVIGFWFTWQQDVRQQDLEDRRAKTEEQLATCKSLEGATMPNGQKYEDWLRGKKK